MGITRTLGGDRLGSGKKMKVHMHGYERSTHDLGYIFRSSMSCGTLVPFLKILALPGDTFDIDLDCVIKTHPTVGPLFGSFKVQLDIFQAPIRLYQSLLHNNMLGIGLQMSKVKLPKLTLIAPTYGDEYTGLDNNWQINPSCILSYLGIRGIGYQNSNTEGIERSFNGVPLLAYWEIYKQYYSNKQEKIGAVIHTGVPEVTDNVVTPIIYNTEYGGVAVSIDVYETSSGDPASGTVPLTSSSTISIDLSNTTPINDNTLFLLMTNGYTTEKVFINDVMETFTQDAPNHYTGTFKQKYWGWWIVNWQWIHHGDLATTEPRVTTFNLSNLDDYRKEILAHSSETVPFDMNTLQEPIQFLTQVTSAEPYVYSKQYSQEGLAIKTYQSDIFNNWLDTADLTYISNTSAVSTVGNKFTIDQLNIANKVYEMLTRIQVSGGTYNDWLDAVYTHERYYQPESPIYHGGLIKELVFQEVVSNTETATQPLGQLAGKGVMSNKHKGGKVVIKVDEPAYIIGIVSITPRLDYSQGNDWDIHLQTIDDLHKPAMDEIGFQDLITEQMAWFDTTWDGTNWIQKSAGKQPAWLNYMTNYNRTYGSFAINDPGEMFMTLNRRYEFDEDNQEIKDLTTYIDPVKFNYIFADTSLDAQNFWTQIAVDITARRKMSAKIMPNL